MYPDIASNFRQALNTRYVSFVVAISLRVLYFNRMGLDLIQFGDIFVLFFAPKKAFQIINILRLVWPRKDRKKEPCLNTTYPATKNKSVIFSLLINILSYVICS